MKIFLSLIPLINIIGAVLTYTYFVFILPPYKIPAEVSSNFSFFFFVAITIVILLIFLGLTHKFLTPISGIANKNRDINTLDPTERGRLQGISLKVPLVVSIFNLLSWVLAGFIFGFMEPVFIAHVFSVGTPDLVLCLRRFLGIALLGGGITTLILFFVLENVWRSYIPVFFPNGDLSRVKHVFKLNVQKRLLVVFLAVICIPLPIIGMTIYSKVVALNMADAITRSHIMSSLVGEMAFIAADSIAISLILTYMLSRSISAPLLRIKDAKEVENNNLDARVEIVSNDEIGEVAEGFNAMIKSLKETRELKDSFGKYVCKKIRDEIIAGNPALDGEMKRVTLLFSDLRNFTGMVEKYHPKQVVTIMNQYFHEMTMAIKEHKGLILQYVGDEIEAGFGAPIGFDDHPEMAVEAALEMRKRLIALNKKLVQQGFEPLAHGVGIHSGAVLAGNMGCQARKTYTLTGDTVNSASRIEGLTKKYGCDIILSQTTHDLLTDSYRMEQLPPVKVKGKKEELMVYKLLSR